MERRWLLQRREKELGSLVAPAFLHILACACWSCPQLRGFVMCPLPWWPSYPHGAGCEGRILPAQGPRLFRAGSFLLKERQGSSLAMSWWPPSVS